MNGFITFVVLTTVLGMAGVNLSLPLVAEAGQAAAHHGLATGFNGFMGLCLSVAGVGLVLALKAK